MATRMNRDRSRAFLSVLPLLLALVLALPSGAAPAGPRGSPPKSRIGSRPTAVVASVHSARAAGTAASLPKSLLAAAAAPAHHRAPAAAREGLRRFVSALSAQGRDDSGFASLRDAFDRAGGGRPASESEAPVVNDEGVLVFEQAARYYREIRRLVEKLAPRVDLSESLDVMDDTYADVWAKLKVIEAVAASRGVGKNNTHLVGTLTWVDGVLEDKAGAVAVHTTQVFFHHAQNPRSEIEEGIRRVDRALEEMVEYFKPEGLAEGEGGLNKPLRQVVLAFDTRGYGEIKQHLKEKESELARVHGDRYRFAFVDELARAPASREALRAELNGLIQRYQGEGLAKIISGVTYSRYVGLLLELNTIDHFTARGYAHLQSGREVFDAEGKYVTEIDALLRSPKGEAVLVEAKSARVRLPKEKVLQDKIVYKLETYKNRRGVIESAMGSKFDRVVFSVDVGPLPEPGARKKIRNKAFLARIMENQKLADYLKSKEGELSRRYGFPVSFLFLDSRPPRQPSRR